MTQLGPSLPGAGFMAQAQAPEETMGRTGHCPTCRARIGVEDGGQVKYLQEKPCKKVCRSVSGTGCRSVSVPHSLYFLAFHVVCDRSSIHRGY